MKRIIPFLLLLVTVQLIIFGCRKHEKAIDRKSIRSSSVSSFGQNDFEVTEQTHGTSDPSETVLGSQYTFPFKSDIIMQAWNNLSENDLTTAPVTHHYVKFTPQNEEELAELIDSRLPLYDFPLDYEMISLGHVWENSAAIPEMYTFIPVDATMPNISHQILYDVCFIYIESIVAEEAFSIAGLSDDYPYKRTDEPNPAYDECPANINTVINDKLGWRELTWEELNPYGGGVGGYNNGGLDFNTPVPNDVANHCGCNANDDDREPSGCVLVEETQFNPPLWSGVRNVMVEFFGPYGQRMTTWTDQTGCFNIPHKMRYKVWRPFQPELRLPVFMSVTFISNEVTIRSALPAGLASIVSPCTHIVGNMAPGGLNWIRVFFRRSRDRYALSTAYYSAASLNNAHYEYKDMSWQDGILPPPSDMHYFIHPYSDPGDAAAPMLRQLIKSGQPATIIQLGVVLWAFGHTPVIGWGAEAYLRTCPPDIIYNTNQGGNWDNFSSDRIKEIMYHELGHATHFRKAGNQFWLNNINYVASQSVASGGNAPYGNGTAAGWERCALVEMWGFHIGQTYTHRRYGTNHSAGTDPITNSWFARLERELLWWGFIPVGLPHDLMDNNVQNLNVNPGLTDNVAMGASPGMLDEVAGFTNLMFYNELGPNSQTIFQWRDNVRNNQLPGTWNSVNDYNILLGIYGL